MKGPFYTSDDGVLQNVSEEEVIAYENASPLKHLHLPWRIESRGYVLDSRGGQVYAIQPDALGYQFSLLLPALDELFETYEEAAVPGWRQMPVNTDSISGKERDLMVKYSDFLDWLDDKYKR